ncbi:hypothetical protein SLS56_006149 [Neofusicoccum ribis]|uniref:Uncharacterized protein n=1 Tax=Neofusicoccum ribis TaxID=45134 RepID=A0ABR3SRM8_9PEZI
MSKSLELDVEEYMEHRRGSIGVLPTQVLIEWSYGIKLPQYVFENKSVVELRRISTDATIFVNDILSYPKDLLADVTANESTSGNY